MKAMLSRAGLNELWAALSAQPLTYKSSGLRPVFLAIRDNILGPISSLSWKAKITSGQLGRERVL
jgi:hypothetical protein